jgi:hypothetical protein
LKKQKRTRFVLTAAEGDGYDSDATDATEHYGGGYEDSVDITQQRKQQQRRQQLRQQQQQEEEQEEQPGLVRRIFGGGSGGSATKRTSTPLESVPENRPNTFGGRSAPQPRQAPPPSEKMPKEKLFYHFKRLTEYDKVIRYCKLVSGFVKRDLKDMINIYDNTKTKRRPDGKEIGRKVFYEFSDMLYAPWYEVMEEIKTSMDPGKREELNEIRKEEMKNGGLATDDDEVDFVRGINACSYGASEPYAFENEWLFQRFACNETFLLYAAKFTTFNMITSTNGLTPRYETAKMMNQNRERKNDIYMGLWRAMKELEILRYDLHQFI